MEARLAVSRKGPNKKPWRSSRARMFKRKNAPRQPRNDSTTTTARTPCAASMAIGNRVWKAGEVMMEWYEPSCIVSIITASCCILHRRACCKVEQCSARNIMREYVSLHCIVSYTPTQVQTPSRELLEQNGSRFFDNVNQPASTPLFCVFKKTIQFGGQTANCQRIA